MIIESIKTNPHFLTKAKNELIKAAHTSACIVNNVALKPLKITVNTAMTSIKTIGTIQFTALESLCAAPLFWYGKDAIKHSSECGVASLLHAALQGDLFAQVVQSHWTDSSDWMTLDYWTSLYSTLSAPSTASLFDRLFVGPFQESFCKNFAADMMVVGPCALLILASLTTRISTIILKNTLADIYSKYRASKQPSHPSIEELQASLHLIPQQILLQEIALSLERTVHKQEIIKQ